MTTKLVKPKSMLGSIDENNQTTDKKYESTYKIKEAPFLPSTEELWQDHEISKKIFNGKYCFKYLDRYYFIDSTRTWNMLLRVPTGYSVINVDSSSIKKFFGTDKYYQRYKNQMLDDAFLHFVDKIAPLFTKGKKFEEVFKKECSMKGSEYQPTHGYDPKHHKFYEQDLKIWKNKSYVQFIFRGRFCRVPFID